MGAGADVAKALALGAKMVLIGRPYAYGLAIAGEAGVSHVLRSILADLDLTLHLGGIKSVSRSVSAKYSWVHYMALIDKVEVDASNAHGESYSATQVDSRSTPGDSSHRPARSTPHSTNLPLPHQQVT